MILLCVCSQSCPFLWDPMDCSPPGFSVHGPLQARILEWVGVSFSRGSSQPRDQTHVSCVSGIGRHVLPHWHHLGSQMIILVSLICKAVIICHVPCTLHVSLFFIFAATHFLKWGTQGPVVLRSHHWQWKSWSSKLGILTADLCS